MSKKLILGCCSTGAKFTSLNHRSTGDAVFDRICSGADIAKSYEQVAEELRSLASLGCLYYHYHARNPATGEQTTDNDVYRVVGRLAHAIAPKMRLSWGASRNGPEVMQRIQDYGEWERVSQAALPLHDGGAHFVTMQAAIELQILRDLEEQTWPVTIENASSEAFLAQVRSYRPSSRLEDVVMETNSTANGNNYGRSSPAIQMQAYGRAIAARCRLGLGHEVEWVQYVRSYAMTRFAIERTDLGLASDGGLNVTILFGFSPRLPFPSSYEEFRSVVRTAKSLERDCYGQRRRRVTVSVGAAVLPHHAARHHGSFSEGRRHLGDACAVRRLVAYAAREDSEVDILRVGMEDTPYMVEQDGRIRPTCNAELVRFAADAIEAEGAEIATDASTLQRPLTRVANRLSTLAA
jgi:hypothetical protein